MQRLQRFDLAQQTFGRLVQRTDAFYGDGLAGRPFQGLDHLSVSPFADPVRDLVVVHRIANNTIETLLTEVYAATTTSSVAVATESTNKPCSSDPRHRSRRGFYQYYGRSNVAKQYVANFFNGGGATKFKTF